MNNVEAVADCLYYISMIDALVDEGGTKSDEGGLTVIRGLVDVSDTLKVSYELADYSHPEGDPFEIGPLVHYLKVSLLQDDNILRKSEMFKSIGKNDQNYLKKPASVEEKLRYIRKSTLISGKYVLNIDAQNQIPREAQKVLMQYTRELIAKANKKTREKK